MTDPIDYTKSYRQGNAIFIKLKKQMKRIYISGQITGLKKEDYEYNFSFAETFIHLHYDPIIVENPIKITSHLSPVIHTEHQYMLANLEILFKCDTIFMINNWKNSKWAPVEHAIAQQLGFQVIYQDTSHINKC